MKLELFTIGRPLVLALAITGVGLMGCQQIQAVIDLVGLGEAIVLGDEEDEDDDDDDDDADEADDDAEEADDDADDRGSRASAKDEDEGSTDRKRDGAADEAPSRGGDRATDEGSAALADEKASGGSRADEAAAPATDEKKAKKDKKEKKARAAKSDASDSPELAVRTDVGSGSTRTDAPTLTARGEVVPPPATAFEDAAPVAAPATDARPVKVLMSKPEITGALSADAVGALKKKVRGALRGCYREALSSGASETAKTTVVIIVSETGAVKSAELRDSTIDHAAAEACMKGKLAKIVFPAPAGGGSSTLKYAVEFSVSDDAAAAE